MKEYSPREITDIIKNRNREETLKIHESLIKDVDMSGWDLTNTSFEYTRFENVKFNGANFNHASIRNATFLDCEMKNIKLTNADAREAILRYTDMSGSDFSGTNFYASVLENANLDGVKDNAETKFFRMCCPEKGAFIGWKCCTDLKVVQLLIPADARRVSATMRTCRCDKAKVLSIKSIDETISYEWAQSTVDKDFYYEKGKWVYPSAFEPDRWKDSYPGIHFFMERQECIDYQSK